MSALWNKYLLVMVGFGMAAASFTACADNQNFDSRWYIAPQYSYVWPDSKAGTQDGSGWQLNVGKPISEDWDLELGVIDYKLDFKNGVPGSLHQTAYGLNGLWFFNDRPKVFSPFVLLGAGANDQRSTGVGSATKGYGTIGIGFLTSPWNWDGAIRVSVQDLHTFGNGNFNDVIADVGLQIPLGAAPESEPEPEPVSEPVAEPSPAPPPPAPAPVPAPEKVIELPGVEFATNSAHLLAESEATLDTAVQTLRDNPDINAEVAGYTSSTGKASYNLYLSQRRAEAVMKYLVDHGIAAGRLTAKGFGEADPIASNKTAAGRIKNQRVELRVIGQP